MKQEFQEKVEETIPGVNDQPEDEKTEFHLNTEQFKETTDEEVERLKSLPKEE